LRWKRAIPPQLVSATPSVSSVVGSRLDSPSLL